MRTIKRTNQFKRDYKREKRGRHGKTLDSNILQAAGYLTTDQNLPLAMHDPSLSGEWKDCRDCHIKPDLILIYRKPDSSTLELLRLGSHSELGL